MREILVRSNRTGEETLYHLEEQVNEWDEYYDVVYHDGVPVARLLKIGVNSMTCTRFLIQPAGKHVRQYLFDSEEYALSTL